MTRHIVGALFVVAVTATASVAQTQIPISMVNVLAAGRPITGSSPTCGSVTGKTQKDLNNVIAFCAKGIVKGAVVGADAMDSLLWLSVSRPMADGIMSDRLSGKELVIVWMRGWKRYSGSQSVTVTVLWKDVEIVEGQTTALHGDQITFK
jgi:hypothetical protein